jgi:hypothetical protein
MCRDEAGASKQYGFVEVNDRGYGDLIIRLLNGMSGIRVEEARSNDDSPNVAFTDMSATLRARGRLVQSIGRPRPPEIGRQEHHTTNKEN